MCVGLFPKSDADRIYISGEIGGQKLYRNDWKRAI